MATRIPASQHTREELMALIEGRLTLRPLVDEQPTSRIEFIAPPHAHR
jgi:hypothetical protein